ncbi:MAG: nitrate- and nitrite sensing domain-containing protein [Mycobacteriales bacterium]
MKLGIVGHRRRRSAPPGSNLPIRAKVGLVTAVSATAILLVAALATTAAFGTWSAARRDARQAAADRPAQALLHDLQRERDLTTGVLAATGVNAGKQTVDSLNAELKQARLNTDRSSQEWREQVTGLGGAATRPPYSRVTDGLGQLPALRQAIGAGSLTAATVLGSYGNLISGVLALPPQVPPAGAGGDLAAGVRALIDLRQASELDSQLRGLLFTSAFQDRFAFVDAGTFADLRARRDAALTEFRTDATSGQRSQVNRAVSGQAVLAAARLEQRAADRRQAAKLGIDPQQWWQAATTQLEQYHKAQQSLLDDVVTRSQALATSKLERAWLYLAAGVLDLIIAALATFYIANLIAAPLQRMRAAALNVARQLLPDLMHRLERSEPPRPEDTAPPLDIDTRDEIGQVAQAFNQVHAEAVRGAIEQAELRRNVAQMFTNLARRSQSLVDRQIQLIDQLEQTEDDPDRLSEMFKLDHLATRMRRNDENLLVLAGENTARRWSRPVSLVNVLRAAASEVEQYARVELTALENDLPISGHAVNDVVHLIAELLENATGYSSPRTKVLVSSRMVGPNLMVEIEDQGIGMAPVMLSAINERLSRPPTATDVDVSKHMGLYVVSQLAARHRIKVQLRASPLGGVIAMILIPAACLRPHGEQQLGGFPGGQGFAQPRALTAQPTATPPPPRMPAPQRQPYASGSTPPVQFNTGSFPPAPTQYGTGSTPPVPYGGGSTPPAQYNTGSLPPAPYRPAAGEQARPPQSPPQSPPQPPQPPPFAPAPGYRLDGPGSTLLGGGAEPADAYDERGPEQPPIYATIESEWFRDNSVPPVEAASPPVAPTPAAPAPTPVTPYAAAPVWTTPADTGWQAATGAARPQPAGTTEAGLPRRDPGAQLVPGSARAVDAPPSLQRYGPGGDHERAARTARTLLAAYRDGVERGRSVRDAADPGAPR